jgi:hypothetical protein
MEDWEVYDWYLQFWRYLSGTFGVYSYEDATDFMSTPFMNEFVSFFDFQIDLLPSKIIVQR